MLCSGWVFSGKLMPLTYEILVNFSIVFQIVFFVVAIVLLSRFRRPGLLPLVAVGMAFLTGKIDDLWQQTGLILQYPDWVFSGSLLTLLLGPFILLYVESRTVASFRLRPAMLIHLVWMAPGISWLALNWWPYDAAKKIELATSGGLSDLTTLVLLPAFFDVVLIGYLAASVRRLWAHGIRLQDWFSNIEDRNLSGIRHLLTLFAIMVAIHLFWTLGRYYLWGNALAGWVSAVMVTYHLVLINGLFIEFLTYRYSISDPDASAVSLPTETDEKSGAFSADEQDAMASKLEKHLQAEQPYLNPNLTVADLARPLCIHARTLSWLINHHHECNFHEFVNRHRIEFARAQISRNPERNILEIAYDSGFNSKSAFNTAFKKYARLTPSGFRRSILDQGA